MPTNTEIAQFFAPITQIVNGASYVTFNINESRLTPTQIIQNVNVGGRLTTPAMNVQIVGLADFVANNVTAYSLPIASASVLGGIKVGSGLTINAITGVLDATGGGGTVLSVGDLSPLFTTTNPTTTPTFAQISQAQNLVFASPNGSSGNPTFRALVANDIPALPYVTSAITSLNGLTSATQTFTNDTNVTMVSGGSAHVITWAGLLAPARGGTGVNNSTRTITINTNNAAFTFSGAHTLTVPATGTATLGTGTSGQATFWTGTNTVSGDSAFTWDNTNKRLKVGTATPIGTRVFTVAVDTAVDGFMGVEIKNGTPSGSMVLNFAESATNGGGFNRYNSAVIGTWIGTTSLPLANSVVLGNQSGGSVGNARVLVNATPFVVIGGQTDSNAALFMDTTGLTLTTLTALTSSTTALNRLTVVGNSFFGSNTAANSTLQVGGSLALNYTSYAGSGTYTVLSTDYLINCTTSSCTVALPTAVGITGRIYIIKNTGTATTVTITTSGSPSQTIDGAAPSTVTGLVPLRIMSNGANWITI
jgi:hypothetical protein